MLQVVFRKIADVLREKELAERDRYDNPLEFSTDHPVRRLISRFRKLSCSRAPSVIPGQPLSDFSPNDTLTVEMSLQALASRKTHSVDATADVSRRPSTSDNCPVSNGGTAVNSGGGRAAWKRLLSRASSIDVTAFPAITVLPSNSDNTRTVNSSTTANSEERALLCDSTAPRTPRSTWTGLLPHVAVSDTTTTSAAAPAIAAADNEVFDDEEAGDSSRVAASHSADTVDATVKLLSSRTQSVSSSSAAEDIVSPSEHETPFDMVDLRSELSRQLDTVHGRIDDMNQRLESILRLLADTTAQRGSTDSAATLS